jgi:hypothetical protein
LIALLRILRNVYGCTLPAEVFYYPDEMTDPAERELIESMNAKLVQVKQLDKDHTVWKDFQVRRGTGSDLGETQGKSAIVLIWHLWDPCRSRGWLLSRAALTRSYTLTA